MKKLFIVILLCSALFAEGKEQENLLELQTCNLTLSISSIPINCVQTSTSTVTPVGGTPPYTYLWSDGQTNATATGLSPGTYSVIVSDSAGCVDTAITLISTYIPILITGNVYNVFDICDAEGAIKVFASGGTLPYTYLWNNGNTSDSIDHVLPGTYNVIVCDYNGCCDTSSFLVDCLPFVAPLLNKKDVIISPNPANDLLTIQFSKIEKREVSFSFYDVVGREVFAASEMRTDKMEIDLSHLQRGVYFLRVKTVEGMVMKKVVKE